MSHGATPNEKIATPLNEPEDWCFTHKGTRSSYWVESKTWFEARKKAARDLGVPPDELECTYNPTTRKPITNE